MLLFPVIPTLSSLPYFFFFLRSERFYLWRILVGEKEKRKIAYWRMQGDPETSDPMGQGGEWVL
jgi:hypothetical protein